LLVRRTSHWLRHLSPLPSTTPRSLFPSFRPATAPILSLPLSLHDALPISSLSVPSPPSTTSVCSLPSDVSSSAIFPASFRFAVIDRKSTRLNSSHVSDSHAVFCLKKKTLQNHPAHN